MYGEQCFCKTGCIQVIVVIFVIPQLYIPRIVPTQKNTLQGTNISPLEGFFGRWFSLGPKVGYVSSLEGSPLAENPTPLKINGWNLKITCLKRKFIFQTIIFKFHVKLPGCIFLNGRLGRPLDAPRVLQWLASRPRSWKQGSTCQCGCPWILVQWKMGCISQDEFPTN